MIKLPQMSQNLKHEGNYFRLHSHEADPFNQKPIFSEPLEQTPAASERIEKTDEASEEIKGPRSLKEVVQDAGRQLFASLVILVIGFFALNAGSFYELAKSEYHQIIGTETQTSFTESTNKQQVIPRNTNGATQKASGIPPLTLDVAPDDNRLIISRINQNIPIVRVSSEKLLKRDWKGLEKEMQEALRDGVVHYPGTSLPGQDGNVVITGHSSYFPWDPGRFKDVFVLLHKVVVGDEIVVYYEQKKYIYEVSEIKTVLPQDISVLKQTPGDQITLITCTPIGTNLKRLIVTAKLVEQD